MIDYEDYKRYLEKIGFEGNSLSTYMSYISPNKIAIFENIESYQGLSDNEKLIKFSNESTEFQNIFNQHHDFTNATTFSDLRSGARRYKYYLQYKAVTKSMQEYDQNPSNFDLNGAYICFSVFHEKQYPVKAICKKNIIILELEEDFRTNGAKNVLKKIFNMQARENIQFIDMSEGLPVEQKSKMESDKNMKKINLNQILYGPPGTGKTYNTINKALEIIDGVVSGDRNAAKARFEELVASGQIEFVTFHQSYGYEELVEGIKAIPAGRDGNEDGTEMIYDVVDGVFKQLAKRANKQRVEKNTKSQEQNKRFLLNAKSLNIQAELIEGNDGTYTLLKGSKIRKGVAQSFINYNYNNLRETVLKAAKLKEEIEFYILEEDYSFQSLSAASSVVLGRMSNGLMDWKEVEETKNLFTANEKIEEFNNYILIIDEINRGNISKIFGELITLIEPSKRLGAQEEVRLRLPYSGELFGVPSNLFILGTMNTADRSIALMDTALRRRFEFVEMMPNAALLEFEVEGINLRELLEKINARVEYLYDRDHAIGHAYFMELNAESSLDELNTVMRNKIIPLLQEYFYDDWEKILLVLNDDFVQKKELNSSEIFGKNIDDDYAEEKNLYTIQKDFTKEAYLKIYDRLI